MPYKVTQIILTVKVWGARLYSRVETKKEGEMMARHTTYHYFVSFICYGATARPANDIIGYPEEIATIADIRKIEEDLARKNLAHKAVIQSFQLLKRCQEP